MDNTQNIFRFADKATDNFIVFEMNIDNKSTWINSHYVDPDNCKLFMLLLKSSLQTMKNKGCQYFEQLVLETDWTDFLCENDEWSIVEKYVSVDDVPETILIKCHIDIAHELIIDGFLRNNKTF